MNTSTTFKAEPINEDYEWLQYNEHLRIIHSIKDDMFQAQSIVNACRSTKQAAKWFENKSTQQFEFSHYCDPDETFISLLRLIPKSQEAISLTLTRLFGTPSVKNLMQPFVYTSQSWSAAYEYLKSCDQEMVVLLLQPFLVNIQLNPSLRKEKLSDDFTYKGRNGIINLGLTCYLSSLLQALNSLTHFSLSLIEQKTQDLSDFAKQIRDIFAQMRYVRRNPINPRSLMEVDRKFKSNFQEDASEFFNLLISRLHEQLPSEIDITRKIRGKQEIQQCSGDKIVTRSEDFNLITVPILGYTNLIDSFLSIFEEKDNKVIRKISMLEWPEYLVIQLSRWDYDNKIVQEFAFPIDFRVSKLNIPGTPCQWDYLLTSVIIHKGTAESGHYVTIVQGDDEDWYYCDDHKVKYFEPSELNSWTFGTPDDVSVEDVLTGYLLFYRRSDLPSEKNYTSQKKTAEIMPKDLELKLNSMNESLWPLTVFASKLFCNFIQETLRINPNSSITLKTVLTIFFYIIIEDNKDEGQTKSSLIEEWTSFLQEMISTQESAHTFFSYIQENLTKSIHLLAFLSDFACQALFSLFKHCLYFISDSTTPILTIMEAFDGVSFTKKITGELYDTFEIISPSNENQWKRRLNQ